MGLLDGYKDKRTKLQIIRALDIEAKIELFQQQVDVVPHTAEVEINLTMILAAAETHAIVLFKSVPPPRLLDVVFAFGKHHTLKKLLGGITREMRIYLLQALTREPTSTIRNDRIVFLYNHMGDSNNNDSEEAQFEASKSLEPEYTGVLFSVLLKSQKSEQTIPEGTYAPKTLNGSASGTNESIDIGNGNITTSSSSIFRADRQTAIGSTNSGQLTTVKPYETIDLRNESQSFETLDFDRSAQTPLPRFDSEADPTDNDYFSEGGTYPPPNRYESESDEDTASMDNPVPYLDKGKQVAQTGGSVDGSDNGGSDDDDDDDDDDDEDNDGSDDDDGELSFNFMVHLSC